MISKVVFLGYCVKVKKDCQKRMEVLTPFFDTCLADAEARKSQWKQGNLTDVMSQPMERNWH
jgi:hypothetical protein